MFGLFKVANDLLRGRRGVLIWKCQRPVSLACPATPYAVCLHSSGCAVRAPGRPAQVGLGAGAQL